MAHLNPPCCPQLRPLQVVRRLGEHLEGHDQLRPEEYAALVGRLDTAMNGAAAYIRCVWGGLEMTPHLIAAICP